jgi:hypothetical protein
MMDGVAEEAVAAVRHRLLRLLRREEFLVAAEAKASAKQCALSPLFNGCATACRRSSRSIHRSKRLLDLAALLQGPVQRMLPGVGIEAREELRSRSPFQLDGGY